MRRKGSENYTLYPYDAEVLTALAMLNYPQSLKGIIAQTSGRKSEIITMLAAFMALQGNFVDIVTLDKITAVAEYKKYKIFFATLNITFSHIYEHKNKAPSFEAQVLCGTAADLAGTLVERQQKVCIFYYINDLPQIYLSIDYLRNYKKFFGVSEICIDMQFAELLGIAVHNLQTDAKTSEPICNQACSMRQ